ncbi:hypothetical protein EYF80_026222 [Liparis tanakae]|uniref:Uncharacterized protein n=1 Tax=Liparis tanakae TaxID=230148 RepID=A0A4Z2HDG8_9TELE|nr:hypothetical protein EYF80_026222 [Liparis tanakae]
MLPRVKDKDRGRLWAERVPDTLPRMNLHHHRSRFRHKVYCASPPREGYLNSSKRVAFIITFILTRREVRGQHRLQNNSSGPGRDSVSPSRTLANTACSSDFLSFLPGKKSQKAHNCATQPSHCLPNPTCLSSGHPSTSESVYPAPPLGTRLTASMSRAPAKKAQRGSREGLRKERGAVMGCTWWSAAGIATPWGQRGERMQEIKHSVNAARRSTAALNFSASSKSAVTTETGEPVFSSSSIECNYTEQ